MKKTDLLKILEFYDDVEIVVAPMPDRVGAIYDFSKCFQINRSA